MQNSLSKEELRRPLKEKADYETADNDEESKRGDSPRPNLRVDAMSTAGNVSGAVRIGILVLLCMQNTSHALVTRYSQGMLKEKYSATEVVFVGEIIKLVFSGYFAFRSDDSEINIGTGWRKLFWLITHSQSVVVLVVLYSIGNVMSYYALGKVEASVYTVLSQLKILTTAAFSMLLLGKTISFTKWRALMMLIIGCILVASPTFNKAIDCTLNSDGTSKINVRPFSPSPFFPFVLNTACNNCLVHSEEGGHHAVLARHHGGDHHVRHIGLLRCVLRRYAQED